MAKRYTVNHQVSRIGFWSWFSAILTFLILILAWLVAISNIVQTHKWQEEMSAEFEEFQVIFYLIKKIFFNLKF